MTDKKQYRVKDNPMTPNMPNCPHPYFKGGEVDWFWTRPGDDNMRVNGQYRIGLDQLEPVEEFTFKNRTDIDGISVYINGKFQMNVYGSTTTETVDVFEKNQLELIRMYRGAIAYRESKNSERQKYIDALSSIITTEAAGALFDAGFNLPEKD